MNPVSLLEVQKGQKHFLSLQQVCTEQRASCDLDIGTTKVVDFSVEFSESVQEGSSPGIALYMKVHQWTIAAVSRVNHLSEV